MLCIGWVDGGAGMPEKMKVCGKYPQPDRIAPSYKVGWNACLDEILK